MTYRFVVKHLQGDEDATWIRIPKIGRVKLGKSAGRSYVKVANGQESVRLQIHEGLAEDSGKMVVRIAPAVCLQLGLKEMDVVEIAAAAEKRSEVCILAIDCSLSMGDNRKIDRVMDAVRDFLDEKTKIKEDGDIVGCIGFAADAWFIFQPSRDYASKLGHLEKPSLRAGTNLVSPLEMACVFIQGGKAGAGKVAKADKSADRPALKHVILLADGNSEKNPADVALICKQAGIVVDAVGVIDPANAKHQLANLETIAHITGGKYVDIDQADLAKLRGLFRRAAKDKTLTGA